MYVQRDLVTLYLQTVFGPLWYVIQPFLTAGMYLFVFSGLVRVPTGVVPPALFYLAGVFLWNYFNACFYATYDIFAANTGVFGKVYFPRLVVPLACLISNLVKVFIQLPVFALVYIIYVWIDGTEGVGPNWTLLLTPVYVFLTGLLSIGVGLICTSLSTKYRDVKFFASFIVQLLMFATPVIYPLSLAPESYRTVLAINPLAYIFEAFKYGCFTDGIFDPSHITLSALCILVVFVVGILMYGRVERNFMDTI